MNSRSEPGTSMPLDVLERTIRKEILAIEDRPTQDALFSMLALIHEVRTQQPEPRARWMRE